MKVLFIFLSAVLFIFSAVATSQATLWEWNFTAEAYNPSGPGTATGTFGWDDSAPNQSTNSSEGKYYTGFLNASVTGGPLDGQSFSYNSSGTTGVGNLFIDTRIDSQDNSFCLVMSEWITGGTIGRVELAYNPNISSLALPTSLNLSDFGIARVVLGEYSGSASYSINSITPVNPVPEPATMLLLGSGLVGLVGLGRKRFRNN